MTETGSEISRRQFLNPNIWAAALEGSKRQQIETIAAQSIETHLGLKPEQVHLSFWFGNHILDDEVYNKIQSNRADIVISETSPSVLLSQLRDDSFESTATNPHSYSEESNSREEIVQSLRNVKSLLRSGKTIVSVDNGPEAVSSFIEEGLRRPSVQGYVIEGILTLGSMLPFAIPAYKLLRSHSQLSRRDFLKYVSLLIGGSLSSPLLAKLATSGYRQVNNGRPPLSSVGLSADLALESLMKQGVFTNYVEGMVILRNKIMAVNLWNSIARSVGKNDKGIRLLFHAGAGHDGVVDEFLKGPNSLEVELSAYANRLSTITLEEINKLPGSDDVKTYMYARYGLLFAQAHDVGQFTMDKDKLAAKTIPRSARAILSDTVTKRIKDLSAFPSPDQQKVNRLRYMMNYSLQKDAMFDNDLSEAAGRVTGKNISPLQEIDPATFINFQALEGLGWDALWFKPDEQLLAVAQYNGRAFPVLRSFYPFRQPNQPQAIIVWDSIPIAADRQSILGRYTYIEDQTPVAPPFVALTFHDVYPDLTDGATLAVETLHDIPSGVRFKPSKNETPYISLAPYLFVQN